MVWFIYVHTSLFGGALIKRVCVLHRQSTGTPAWTRWRELSQITKGKSCRSCLGNGTRGCTAAALPLLPASGGRVWTNTHTHTHTHTQSALFFKMCLIFLVPCGWCISQIIQLLSFSRPLLFQNAFTWKHVIFSFYLCVFMCTDPMLPGYEQYYGFTKFAMELNELDPLTKPLLPPTDTRLRFDQRYKLTSLLPSLYKT